MLIDIMQRIEVAQKRLDELENPPPEEEESKVVKRGQRKPKNLMPEDQAASIRQPTQVSILSQAEESKTKETKGKKAAEEAKKKKGEKDEAPELSPEEMKQQRLESDMADLRVTIEELNEVARKINEKQVLIKNTRKKLSQPITEFDFTDRAGDRKYLKTKMEEYANTVLTNKGQYSLVSITEEQEVEPFAIDGYWMRTPEEDETYVEEPVDPKKGKGKKK